MTRVRGMWHGIPRVWLNANAPHPRRTVTADPTSPGLTHVIVSETEARKPGAKARKASGRIGVHTVGLGWLLTSVAERRRVGEMEEVARPLGTARGVEDGGVSATEDTAQEAGIMADSGGEAAIEVEAGESRRRSGRSRVAVDDKARVEAKVKVKVEVEADRKPKRERSPSPQLARDQPIQSSNPLLATATATATTNAPHPRFTVEGDYHLLEHDGAPCTATLNQTDIRKNNNKVRPPARHTGKSQRPR